MYVKMNEGLKTPITSDEAVAQAVKDAVNIYEYDVGSDRLDLVFDGKSWLEEQKPLRIEAKARDLIELQTENAEMRDRLDAITRLLEQMLPIVSQNATKNQASTMNKLASNL